MKLSSPVYLLKRKARLLSRESNIPLHEALDRIAREEGFSEWSLLASHLAEISPAAMLFSQLVPGDLVLVGARPGQGKTLMSLELAVEAMKNGNRAVFFTLEYTDKDIHRIFGSLGVELPKYEELFDFDCSDSINSDYIMRMLSSSPRGTLAVVDYLQLLDQKREHPELRTQVSALKAFALERGIIIVFISQIARSYDPSQKACPDMEDVRLPNPLDLKLFNKTCFLNNGEVRLGAARAI